MSLFLSSKKNTQLGIEFLPAGVSVVQVETAKKSAGRILQCTHLPAVGMQAQTKVLQDWIRSNRLLKVPCICLISVDDCSVYQVEKPDVDSAELIPALTWRVKDLLGYDVGNAVVETYPMPVSAKNNTQQVSVVCARESIISAYVDTIKEVGLELVAIDIHDLVGKNLKCIQQGAEQTQAILSLGEKSGFLSVYHDTDLYVSRDLKIGVEQILEITSDDVDVYDSLLLEIQRSMDYFESYYGLGSVSSLQIFPQLPETEKMAMYLQNLVGFDIDFVSIEDSPVDGEPVLDRHCFHAYGAALRGVAL